MMSTTNRLQPAAARGVSAPALIVLTFLTIAVAIGCGGDPYRHALEERARWTVTLTSWVADEGGYRLTTRLSGPPNGDLERLTVAIDLLGADGERLERVWHTYDLTQIARGGPKDVSVRVPAPGIAVDGIGISLVPSPTDDEVPRIEELRGLRPAGG